MPARFYCPDPPNDGIYRLKANEAKHLSRVCRIGVGDEVEISTAVAVRGLRKSSPWPRVGWI